jgi:uncharacterized protein YcfJ
MLNLKKTKLLSAVAIAMAASVAPNVAVAGTYTSNSAYENCKRSDTENQILGGVIGAISGGVLGSQVAGNGARTEGSALGAVVGAVAGSQIANKDCRSANHHRVGYPVTESYPAARTTVYQPAPVYTQSQPVYRSSPVVQTRGYNTVYTSPRVETVRTVSHNNYGGYGHSGSYGVQRRGYNEIADINRQIEDLRYRRDKLVARNRYEQSYSLDRRIDRIGHKISDLKKRKRYLKKRNKRGYDDDYKPRRSGHYHGSNICYTSH